MDGAEKDQQSPLVRSLGWFSAGLGLAQLATPGTINRLVGVDDSGAHRVLMRMVGVRELAAGAGILGRARPAAGLWARVAGDAMDVAMLGAALRADGKRRGRMALATASVVAVTAADVVASTRTSRNNGSGTGEHPMHAKATTTVKLPADEVYQYWRDLEHLPKFMDHLESVEVAEGPRSHWVAHGPAGTTVEWDAEIVEDVPGELIAWRSLDGADVANTGSVRFAPASRDQGTEVTIELSYAAPSGAVGSAVAKLLGEEPALQVKDDLRRFKQVLETGEVLLSDGSPGGIRALGQLRQRPGQPAG